MATKSQLEVMHLYGNLMAEVKLRLETIQSATAGNLGLIGPLVKEFCYLQLRMICELVAIACLVMHGDIRGAAQLKNKWNADAILKRLGELQPDFFPSPQEIKNSSNPSIKAELHGPLARKSPYTTKDKMLELYGKCGDVLHRGSLKKLLSQRVPLQIHFPDIDEHVAGLKALLDVHSIFLNDKKTMFFCQLQRIGLEGGLSLFEKESDPPP